MSASRAHGRADDCASRVRPPHRRTPDFPSGGMKSEDQAHHPLSSTVRRTRTVAIAAGLVAVAALAVPSAQADTTTTFSAQQLSAASDAVLGADVAGTAWNIDPVSKKLVVTADRTVSKAEIEQIKQSAGANAGALKIERTTGKISKLLSGGDAIYAPAGAVPSASTSAAAAPTTS